MAGDQDQLGSGHSGPGGVRRGDNGHRAAHRRNRCQTPTLPSAPHHCMVSALPHPASSLAAMSPLGPAIQGERRSQPAGRRMEKGITGGLKVRGQGHGRLAASPEKRCSPQPPGKGVVSAATHPCFSSQPGAGPIRPSGATSQGEGPQ